jgi:hypothetical protein
VFGRITEGQAIQDQSHGNRGIVGRPGDRNGIEPDRAPGS